MVKPVRCMWAEFLKPLFLFSKEKKKKKLQRALAAHKPAGVLGRFLTCI
jgi:hypothetical protein